MNLHSEVREDVTLVKLPSEAIDASISPQFKAALAALIRPGAKIVLDLSQTSFVDSSGLGTLIWGLKRLHEVGGDLRLCQLTKPVRALFELVRMHRVFEIFNTPEEAVRSFKL